MKKILVSFIILIMCLTLTACDFLNIKNTYTVVFLNYDNSLLYKASDIEEGQPAIYAGETPTRPEVNGVTYTFIGWDKDISVISSDLTVFAKYVDSQNNESTITTLDKISFSTPKIRIQSNTQVNKNDITSFRDDNYYYFVFDLGKYYNIPIESTYDYCTYGGSGNITKTMTASNAQSSTIENSITYTQQSTINFSLTGEAKHSETVGWKLMDDGVEVGANATVESGFSATIGVSNTEIWSETFTEAATYSESESRTTTISFQSGDNAGNYYYYLSVDTQVYGVIIKNFLTGEYFITTKSSIIGRGFNYIYCGNEKLNFECDDKLDFDYASIIEKYNLDNMVPEKYTGIKNEDGMIHISNDAKFLYYALKNAKEGDVLILDEDVDCENYPWNPIDNFCGKLLGNDKSIKNLSIKIDSGNSESMIGLFKELSGTISNLTIDNLIFDIHKYHDTLENIYVGAICGRLVNGKIEICKIVNSNIYAYHDSDDKTRKTRAYVGGYVGELSNGNITNCSIENTTIYGKTRINYDTKSTADCWSYVGGIVGYLNGGVISDCIRLNDVNVTAYTLSGSKTSAYHCHVGGIAGYKDSGDINGCSSSEIGLAKTTEVIKNRKANSSSSGLGSLIGN